MMISQSEFQDIAKSVPGIIYQFCIDNQGQQSFSYVSPVIHRLLGLDPQDVMKDAMLWINQIHNDDMDNFTATVNQSLTSMEPWHWEGRMIHVNGKVAWFRGESIPSKKGNSIVWSGIVTDITKQHEAEEELKFLAITDPLTNLYNRRYFTETFLQNMRLAQRNRMPLSLMLYLQTNHRGNRRDEKQVVINDI